MCVVCVCDVVLCMVCVSGCGCVFGVCVVCVLCVCGVLVCLVYVVCMCVCGVSVCL